jgi:hypothetical protein
MGTPSHAFCAPTPQRSKSSITITTVLVDGTQLTYYQSLGFEQRVDEAVLEHVRHRLHAHGLETIECFVVVAPHEIAVAVPRRVDSGQISIDVTHTIPL